MINQSGKFYGVITTIKQKIDLINYQNVQPPYLLNTLAQLRITLFNDVLHKYNLASARHGSGMDSYVQFLAYLADNLQYPPYQVFRQLLVKPYINKLKKSKKQFEALKMGQEKNGQLFGNEGPLFWVAQWLIEIQITEDLLSQVELYFDIKVPNLRATLKDKANNYVSDSWTEAIYSKAKRFLSRTLKTGSEIMQSSIFTGIVSSALLITIMVLQINIIPLSAKLSAECFAPVGLVTILPSIFQSIYSSIDKAELQNNLKKWQITLSTLTLNIRKFNNYLQSAIRGCMKCEDSTQYQKQKTNIQKFILSLTTNTDVAVEFEEEKFEQLKNRTEAYFKQYKEIPQGDWILITSKQLTTSQYQNKQEEAAKSEHFEQLKIEKAKSFTRLEEDHNKEQTNPKKD